jgi:pSer/pThr/pTyr-binding forkhead associated (FHA) protein
MRRLRVFIDYGNRKETQSFSGFPVRIGRGESTECRIDLPHVSRCHARLELEDGRLILRDGGSRCGTFIRAARLRVPARTAIDLAAEGNEFQIGLVRLRAELLEEGEEDEDATLVSEGPGEDETLAYDGGMDPEALDSEAARRPLNQDLEAYRHSQATLRRAVLAALQTLDVKRARGLLAEVIGEFPELMQSGDVQRAAAQYRIDHPSRQKAQTALRGLEGLAAARGGRSSAA